MTEWPDIQCEECGELVGEDGFRVRYENLLMPASVYEPDYYGWCLIHSPETAEAEEELLDKIRKGPREDWLDMIKQGVRKRPGMYLDDSDQAINLPEELTAEEKKELQNLAIDTAPGRSRKE